MQWEYRTMRSETILNTHDMNKLGELGWELVTAYLVRSGFHEKHTAIFKRPLTQ